MRHLLSTRSLQRDDAVGLLDIAEDMADTQLRSVKKLPTLVGKTVVNLFFEDSTRTRLSFEAAAKRLSADVMTFVSKGSSTSKGESLKDTAQTLYALGADAVIVRHHSSGASQILAEREWTGDAAIINAGDGMHEHPTQALLDAFTIRRRRYGAACRGRDLSGLSIVIVGDILHSRVARSNMWLLSTLGARVTFVAPRTLLPSAISEWPAAIHESFDDVLQGEKPDVVMMLRVQRERMREAFFPTSREYSRLWGLDDERLRMLGPGTIVMHPGPMNRGLEISAAAADDPRSAVREQVANGVSVRMAVLYALMTGEKESAT